MVEASIACVAAFAAPGIEPAAAEASVEIVPSAPRYMEPVYALIRSDLFWEFRMWNGRVSMAGNTITVSVDGQRVFDLCGCHTYVELGRFPSGDYTVRIPQFALTAQFTVPPSDQLLVPAVDYSGIWWNPDEPGWGLHIEQGPTNIIFAVWVVYDSDGKPVWYSLGPGAWSSWGDADKLVYSAPIYKTSGPYFGGPFDPAAVKVRLVGAGTLTFADPYTGALNYMVEGVAGSKTISRMSVD